MWPIVWYVTGWFAIAVPFAFALTKWIKAVGEYADRNAGEHQCQCCGTYGQKAAPVQAHQVLRVVNPVPKAPKK